jgi:hypothetical protein
LLWSWFLAQSKKSVSLSTKRIVCCFAIDLVSMNSTSAWPSTKAIFVIAALIARPLPLSINGNDSCPTVFSMLGGVPYGIASRNRKRA